MARLRDGGLVALPTEAGYEAAASALHAEAVAELCEIGVRHEPPALVLAQAAEAFDWLPRLRGAAVRLARRGWPGPLVLASDAGVMAGLAVRLPSEVRENLLGTGSLALRAPDHDCVASTLRALGGPMAVAPLPGFPQETSRIQAGRDRLALILDAGASSFVKPPSVVRAGPRSCTLVREGALAWDDLVEASRCHVLFVCTGNTCRSPLAQALCTKLLADTLGCAPAELPERGFRVQSAGLAAMMGNAATPEAALIAREHGGDLANHASQPLTHELIAQADRLFAMTASHLYLLHSLRLAVGPAVQLLSPAGEDIEDPIGAGEEVYRTCAGQILDALRERLPELLEA